MRGRTWFMAGIAAALAAATMASAAPAGASGFAGRNGMAVMTSDDGSPDIVTAAGVRVTNGTTTTDMHPAWDPIHNRIAFQRLFGTKFDILVVNVQGTGNAAGTPIGNPVNITATGNISETRPTWSRDGNRIAFTQDDGAGHVEVITTNAAGGDVRNVSHDASAIDKDPTYSPISGELVWVKNNDLVRGPDSTTGTVTRLTNTSTVKETEPNFRPDGQSLVFVLRGGNNFESSIVAAPLSNISSQTVLVTASNAHSSPKCSPDGKILLFSRYRTDGSGNDVMTADCRSRTTPQVFAFDRFAPDWQRLPS